METTIMENTDNITKLKELFDTLYSLPLTDAIEEFNKFKYVSWAKAWKIFIKHAPDATYTEPVLEKVYDMGYSVHTSITVLGVTRTMWLPVTDSSNKPMKDTSYTYQTKFAERTVEAINTFAVNTSGMRCLVKNMAMFGLGLFIYEGEDLPKSIDDTAKEPISKEEVIELATLEEHALLKNLIDTHMEALQQVVTQPERRAALINLVNTGKLTKDAYKALMDKLPIPF